MALSHWDSPGNIQCSCMTVTTWPIRWQWPHYVQLHLNSCCGHTGPNRLRVTGHSGLPLLVKLPGGADFRHPFDTNEIIGLNSRQALQYINSGRPDCKVKRDLFKSSTPDPLAWYAVCWPDMSWFAYFYIVKAKIQSNGTKLILKLVWHANWCVTHPTPQQTFRPLPDNLGSWF